VEAGRFRLVWLASHEREVALLPAHRIGEGASATERYWFVGDSVDGPELRIVGKGALSCALRQDSDDIWRGKAGEFTVELQPLLPGYIAGLAALGADAPWRDIAEAVLAAGARLSPGTDLARDHVATLATLAGLNDAVLADLRTRQNDDLAQAALARHTALYGDAAPRAVTPGTGWQAPSGSLDLHYETIRRR
jgi:hypothetical protein